MLGGTLKQRHVASYLKKKTDTRKSFREKLVHGGILASSDDLNKHRSYRFRGAAKNLWRHVWTGATANSLGS